MGRGDVGARAMAAVPIVENEPAVPPRRLATIDDLLQKMRGYLPQADLSPVRQAYEFAAAAHEGQRRGTGEPYVQHPLETAIYLADLQLDRATVEAGLLHDVPEDTDRTLQDVEAAFGPEVGRLVDGVTKLSGISWESRDEQQAENLRKMFLAMAEDIRVVLIKLCDRLHNVSTLDGQAPDRPAAHRPRDARHLRPPGPPPGHLGAEVAPGGRRLPPPRAGEVPGAQAPAERHAQEPRAVHLGGHRAGHRAPEADRAGGHDHRPPQAHLLHLQQDAAHRSQLRPALRPAGHPRAGGHAPGVLRRPRRRAQHVAPDPRAVRRLHRRAQGEHVPVPAHRRDRPRRAAPRGADSHHRDAPGGRARHRRPLALQGGGRQPPRSAVRGQAGLAAPADGLAAGALDGAGVRRERQDGRLPGPGLRLHPQGRDQGPAGAGRPPWTSPTASTRTSATTASAAGSTASWCRWTTS